jgi:hypothetical protein
VPKFRAESARRSWRSRALAAKSSAFPAIALVVLPLVGCSYAETVVSRRAAPDPREELRVEDGTLFLARRDIPDYTCANERPLQCDRAGSLYACDCVR